MRAPRPGRHAGPARAGQPHGRRQGRRVALPPLLRAVSTARPPGGVGVRPDARQHVRARQRLQDRHFDDVMREVGGFFAACDAARRVAGRRARRAHRRRRHRVPRRRRRGPRRPPRAALRDDVRPAASTPASRSTWRSSSPSSSGAEQVAWPTDRRDEMVAGELRGPGAERRPGRGDVPALPGEPAGGVARMAEFFEDYTAPHGAIAPPAPPPRRPPSRRPPRHRGAARGRSAASGRPRQCSTATTRTAARRGRAHRREHGGEPRRPDRDVGAHGPGQAARGQPPDPQQPARAHRGGKVSRSRTSSASRSSRARQRAAHELVVRRRRRQASGRAHEHVNLGLAIDLQKDDGSRTLLVPNIKNADTLDFAAFHAAYEDLDPQGAHEQARPPTTSRARPSRSPTPARSAPSTRCRA